MRETKFKALDNRGRWHYYGINSKPQLLGVDYEWIAEDLQYTGLTDKAGVEIYEGDIVKAEILASQRTHEWKYETEGVFWIEVDTAISITLRTSLDKDASMWDGRLINWHRNLEVIGNIYENPELIN